MKQADMEERSSKKMKKKHGKSKQLPSGEWSPDVAGTGLDGAKLVDLLRDALAENGRLRQKLAQAEEERASLEDELAEAQSDHKAAEKELGKLKDEKQGFERQLRNLSDEKHVLEERLAQARMDCDRARDELKKAQAAIEAGQASTARENADDKERLLKLEKDLEAARQQVAGLQDEAEHAAAKSAFLEKALAEAQDNLASTQEELENLGPETQQRALSERIAALEADQRLLAKTVQDQGQTAKELIRTKDELMMAARGKEKAEASARQLARELAQAKEALQKIQKELADDRLRQDPAKPAEVSAKAAEALAAAQSNPVDQQAMPEGSASSGGDPERAPAMAPAAPAAAAASGQIREAAERPADDGSLSCGVTYAGSPLRHSRTVAPCHFPESRKG